MWITARSPTPVQVAASGAVHSRSEIPTARLCTAAIPLGPGARLPVSGAADAQLTPAAREQLAVTPVSGRWRCAGRRRCRRGCRQTPAVRCAPPPLASQSTRDAIFHRPDQPSARQRSCTVGIPAVAGRAIAAMCHNKNVTDGPAGRSAPYATEPLPAAPGSPAAGRPDGSQGRRRARARALPVLCRSGSPAS
jgi:hypothetical protein